MGAAFTENGVIRAPPTAAKIKAKSRTQVVVLLEAGGVLGAEDLSRLGLVFGRPLGSEGKKLMGGSGKKKLGQENRSCVRPCRIRRRL